MLKHIKEVLTENKDDTSLTEDLKAGIVMRLEEKYDNDTIQDLMRMATFVDPWYRGSHFPKDLDLITRQVEWQALLLTRLQQATGEGAEEGGEAAALPPPNKKRLTLGSILGVKSQGLLKPQRRKLQQRWKATNRRKSLMEILTHRSGGE